MKTKEYVTKLKEQLYQIHGNRCFFCGSTKQLEFAHLEPTGLNGMGRGRINRYLDIKKHVGSYMLLCHECHRQFDLGVNLMSFDNALYGDLSNYPPTKVRGFIG
jgi:transcription elongation factor Elf1